MSDSEPEEPAAAEETAAASQRPKPRKRRKKRGAGRDATLRPALDANGRNRPRFLLNFPLDPELETLIEAFEGGNYAHVRKAAPELAARTEDPEIREAALELRRRLDPDPLLKYLLALSCGLLVFLALYMYATHRH